MPPSKRLTEQRLGNDYQSGRLKLVVAAIMARVVQCIEDGRLASRDFLSRVEKRWMFPPNRMRTGEFSIAYSDDQSHSRICLGALVG